MSKKTIANFCGFVIFACFVSLSAVGCRDVLSIDPVVVPEHGFDKPVIIGTITSPEIRESSGIAVSLCQKNVIWTHNDSGDNSNIYAIGQNGDRLGTWRVPDAKNIDWEDIAIRKDSSGRCFLYNGEIGNNARVRNEGTVYKIAEPKVSPSDSTATRKRPLKTGRPETIRFTYPEFRHDAETLLVHPANGSIYIITKRLSGPAGVYRMKDGFGDDTVVTAEKVGDISVPAIPNGFLTGGDISPDGRRVVICDYFGAYELTLPETAENFDDIWKTKPVSIDIGKREQGEAIAYGTDGNSIFATSEKKDSPIIKVTRK